MTNKYKSRTKSSTATAALLCCVALLVSACEQEQLPVDAQLRISPESRTINIADRSDASGTCFIDPNLYVDQPVVLTMTGGDGEPLGHVDISVYVDFSGNTFSGAPVMMLFDDRRGNNNGIVDDFELVSGVGEDIATVKTDFYGGDRPLLLRINVSCPFKGDVFAFSDGVSATAPIELTVGTGGLGSL